MSITAIHSQFVRITYGIFAAVALTSVVIPALILLVFVPTRIGRRRVARWGARLFFMLIGSPVRLEGAHELPTSPCVVVANHASYLDGIMLTAALPPSFTFLIKHEMSTFPFAGFLLRRIGSEFVDRGNNSHRHRVARRLFKAAETGDALAFFPEGTFDAAPGLRRFQPGAFSAAWRAELPVVPIVISGSRAKLPAGSWLCSPGPLAIRVCAPIDPATHASASELLQASRQAMLKWLDEPDLALDERQSGPESLSGVSVQAGGGP